MYDSLRHLTFFLYHQALHFELECGSVSKAVQYFKGGSSKVIRVEFPDLEEHLWGESFWADGYFSETVGQVNWETIQAYIKNQ